MTIAYSLRGRLASLRIPAPSISEQRDGLWEHTCFEAFVASGESSGYREFNFSPSGQWAAYAFSGYRQRDPSYVPAWAPRISVRSLGDRLDLEAVLPPDAVPAAPAGAALRLGLSAVVEAADGSRSYWALAHPGPQPDFHRHEAFALVVPAPDPKT